jgi:thiamine biosynthesis lipoprotein
LFDTVTSIVGRAESEEAFYEKAKVVHDQLLEYHQLFDIYHSYEGFYNLKDVNDNAGVKPVEVDRRIIDLLTDCKQIYMDTNGKVNVAMGSVLNLWHEARNFGRNNPQDAYLPEDSKLKAASEHMDMDKVIIDETASTVFLQDQDMSLDVGAIAKGWSVQRVSETAPTGLLISVGGNVLATGPKDENGKAWVVGVQDPDDTQRYLHTLFLTGGSVVTSGDYQRTYMVDGKMYHHIIDPDTLMPSNYFSSITVITKDSGLADTLSTALFCMSYEEGLELVEKLEGVEVLWIYKNGEQVKTDGLLAIENNNN